MVKLDTVGVIVFAVLTPITRIAGIGAVTTASSTIATASTTTIATTASTASIAVGVGIGKEGIEPVDLVLHLVYMLVTLGTVGVDGCGGTEGAFVGVDHFGDGIIGRLCLLNIADGALELGDAFQEECIGGVSIGILVQGNEFLVPKSGEFFPQLFVFPST